MRLTSQLFIALPQAFYVQAAQALPYYAPTTAPRNAMLELALTQPVQFVDRYYENASPEIYLPKDSAPVSDGRGGQILRVATTKALKALMDGRTHLTPAQKAARDLTFLVQNSRFDADYDDIQEIHWKNEEEVWTLDFRENEFLISNRDGTQSHRMKWVEFLVMKLEILRALSNDPNLHATSFFKKGYSRLWDLDIFQKEKIRKALEKAQESFGKGRKFSMIA